MDYEKKYKDALAHAREIHRNEEGKRKDMEFLFPELKEVDDEEIKEEIINYFECRSKDEPTRKDIHNKWIAWLKKQGNKLQGKTYTFEGKSVLEAINEEKVDNANKVVVESKFKVGDWITDGEKVWKIGYIEDDTYIEHCDSISAGGFIESIDKHYHLWTIADAKAGDVLVDVYGNIGIFEKRYGINWHTYCYLGNEGRFISEGGSHGSICYPATKEQRDILFAKMKKAGYEWDAEKKRLKKIEQNPTYKVKPKFKVGDWVVISTTEGNRVVQIASIEYFKDGHPRYNTTEGRWFGNGTKACLLTDKDVETITIPESKIVVNKSKYWSEEDENRFTNLISLVKCSKENDATKEGFIKFINKLKSSYNDY